MQFGGTAVDIALQNEMLDAIVTLLLNSGAIMKSRPPKPPAALGALIAASIAGDLTLVNQLISAGANVNETNSVRGQNVKKWLLTHSIH